MTREDLDQLAARAQALRESNASEPGLLEQLAGKIWGGDTVEPPSPPPAPAAPAQPGRFSDFLSHLEARQKLLAGGLLTNPTVVGGAEVLGLGEAAANRGRELSREGQQTLADITGRDVQRGERVAEILRQPSPTAATPPPKGARSHAPSPAGKGEQKTATAAPPRGVVIRTPDGRIVITNQPEQYAGENVSDWAAGATAAKQTSENMAGPFRIGGETGTHFTPGFSQYEMPTADKYVGLPQKDFEALKAKESPLVQDLMDENRKKFQQGSLEELQLKAAADQLNPQARAQMELARVDELRKRALEDPGLQLRVIQNMNAWRAKNPNATPAELEQLKQGIMAAAVADYIRANDPELLLAQAKSGLLGATGGV
jgi:hypothetical protein